MTRATLCQDDFGREWEVVSNGYWIKEPCVLVPLSITSACGIAVIGEYVKEFMSYAIECHIEIFADYIISCEQKGKISEEILDGEDERIRMIRAYAGHSEDVDHAISLIDAAKKRAINRNLSKGKRRTLARDYDQVFMAIGRRDSFECTQCGASKSLTIDHIIPLIEGGGNELDNLQILCKSCNSSKGGSV